MNSIVPDPAYPEQKVFLLLQQLLPSRVPETFIRDAVRLQRPVLRPRFALQSKVWIAGRGIPGIIFERHYSPTSKCFMYSVSYGLGGTSEAYVQEGCVQAEIESKPRHRLTRRT